MEAQAQSPLQEPQLQNEQISGYEEYPSDQENEELGTLNIETTPPKQFETFLVNEISGVNDFQTLVNIINDNEWIDDLSQVPNQYEPTEQYSEVSYVHANKIDKYVAANIMHIRDRNHLKAIKKEVDLLSRYFSNRNIHPDLLKFIGVYKLDKEDDPNQNTVVLLSEALSPGNKDLRKIFNSNYLSADVNNPNFIRFFYKLLEIIQHLHANNIVHADIWGPNIVLDIENNRILLIDFGESCILSNDVYPEYLMCKEGVRRPHINFMPPYILDKIARTTKKSLTNEELKDIDIYALAATMYQIFSPEHSPFMDIKQYPTILEDPNIRKQFVKDLSDKINKIEIGDPHEKPKFQQLIIRLLKSREERDRLRDNIVTRDMYEGLNLRDMTIQEDDTPLRTSIQNRQFKESMEAQRRLFVESMGDDPDEEDDEEAMLRALGALHDD